MRFVRPTTVAALLAAEVLAHPTPPASSSQSVQTQPVDLSAYKLSVGSSYISGLVGSPLVPAAQGFADPNHVDIATAFARTQHPSAEFRVLSQYVSGNGVAHVVLKQTVHGIDIDTADMNINVDKNGAILSYGSSFYTGEVPAENPMAKRSDFNPLDALRGALTTLKLSISAFNAAAEAEIERAKYIIKGCTGIVSDPRAHLVYIHVGASIRLSWRVETDVGNNWLLSYVDAANPEMVHAVVDYVSDASYTVYPWKTSDPAHGERVVETDPWDSTASAFTWHGNGEEVFNTTRGNNAVAQANFEGDAAFENDFRPYSADLDFDYPFFLNETDPKVYAAASVTQLFYTVNMYHDLLYVLGFNEVAGNFETDNHGLGGLGGDPVTLNAQDGSGFNNADFATPVDGSVPRMRMFVWTDTKPHRDCSFDASVVIHEYTHGLSNRLTGGPLNGGCLSTTEAGGMGEGWSDFMAIAIGIKTSDTRDTDYPIATWVSGNPKGIRTYPYSTSLQTNPMVYTTANHQTSVHFIGTVWASILYEVLWNLIDAYGITEDRHPTFVDGVPTDGRFLAMQLVVDGMKLQPCRPDFIHARDAIIDADKVRTGGKNQCLLWKAFAKRGLGVDARRSDDPADHESRVDGYSLPAGVCE
ncbi:extracellular elastinolytic metalloproteinase [Diplocarpon mali]|nr:extracellular elastinolytic metalloproteinase [Diplocarpon mali]